MISHFSSVNSSSKGSSSHGNINDNDDRRRKTIRRRGGEDIMNCLRCLVGYKFVIFTCFIMVLSIYLKLHSIDPSLIRLLFHNCFVEGCDASVLLDVDEAFNSEKDASPNLSLKGFDVNDTIKFELENACPGVVSCSDILVLAAREALLVAAGPFYPLETGKKDSVVAFKEIAQLKLSPLAHIVSSMIASQVGCFFNVTLQLEGGY